MEKKHQQDIKKAIRKTYGEIALQDSNVGSSSCCAPGCCSGGGDSPVQTATAAMHQSAETVIIDAITIAPRTIARTATQMLLLYAYAYFFLS